MKNVEVEMAQEVSMSTSNNGTFQVTDLENEFLELHALTTEQSENIQIMRRKR